MLALGSYHVLQSKIFPTLFPDVQSCSDRSSYPDSRRVCQSDPRFFLSHFPVSTDRGGRDRCLSADFSCIQHMFLSVLRSHTDSDLTLRSRPTHCSGCCLREHHFWSCLLPHYRLSCIGSSGRSAAVRLPGMPLRHDHLHGL